MSINSALLNEANTTLSQASRRHHKNNWSLQISDNFSASFITQNETVYSHLLSIWPQEARSEKNLEFLSADIAFQLRPTAETFGVNTFGLSLSCQAEILEEDFPFLLVYDLDHGTRFSLEAKEDLTLPERSLYVGYSPLDEEERERFYLLQKERDEEPLSQEVLENLEQWQKNFATTIAMAQAETAMSMEAQSDLLGLLTQSRMLQLALKEVRNLKGATTKNKKTAHREIKNMREALVQKLSSPHLPEPVRSALRTSLKTFDRAAEKRPFPWKPKLSKLGLKKSFRHSFRPNAHPLRYAALLLPGLQRKGTRFIRPPSVNFNLAPTSKRLSNNHKANAAPSSSSAAPQTSTAFTRPASEATTKANNQQTKSLSNTATAPQTLPTERKNASTEKQQVQPPLDTGKNVPISEEKKAETPSVPTPQIIEQKETQTIELPPALPEAKQEPAQDIPLQQEVISDNTKEKTDPKEGLEKTPDQTPQKETPPEEPPMEEQPSEKEKTQQELTHDEHDELKESAILEFTDNDFDDIDFGSNDFDDGDDAGPFFKEKPTKTPEEPIQAPTVEEIKKSNDMADKTVRDFEARQKEHNEKEATKEHETSSKKATNTQPECPHGKDCICWMAGSPPAL